MPHSNKDAYHERYARADKGHTDRSDTRWPAPYRDIDAGHDAYRETFGVPPEFTPIGAVSIGYPAEPPRRTTTGRKAVGEVLHRHRWGNPA